MKRIEKIELGLFEIARECRIIDRVATNCATLNGLLKNGRHKVEDLLKLPEEHEDFLKDVHGKVAELLEMVGEYMNDHEMIEAVDLAINTPIYDLVYERKTDDDFEKEE